ncbi:hypothetical protein MACH08_38940 [Oceanobacillus kimchii]|uniref:Uncharacterized protein n=1 Tax=Oceanobacillus kimchii TaxID=746691 RepID=A0ABQ5TRV0_9BACI|nr:hypothetical protein MACH08_38940 [Oceanobacillus kimchii]
MQNSWYRYYVWPLYTSSHCCFFYFIMKCGEGGGNESIDLIPINVIVSESDQFHQFEF